MPEQVGRYCLEEYLGGGMAEVYRAVDGVLGRTVAFKRLSPAGTADQQARSRFLEEARVGSQLAHDHIVRTLDYGEQDGRPFMVLEFLSGTSLASLIKSDDWTAVPLRDRVRMALEAARALQYLHTRDILHRDIKPDNIHIERGTRRVRLIDFGIAKAAGANLTQAGFVVGTPFYMAPEQLSGAPIGAYTDVYMFGLVLFEILTGKRARQAETVERVLQQILQEPVDYSPLEQAAEAIPDALRSLVRETTASKVEERIGDFASVVARLEAFLGVTTAETSAPFAKAPQPAASSAVPNRANFRRMIVWGTVAAMFGGLLVGSLGVLIARTKFGVKSVSAAAPPPSSSSPSSASSSGGAANPPTVAKSPGFELDEMVRIPEGDFLYSSERQRVHLPAFEIDRTEVTNERYRDFCRLRKRKLPEGFRADNPGLPVTNVTIDEARAYCFAQGKHLPTARQWERAARYTDGRRFPWGESTDESKANVHLAGDTSPHLVSAYSMAAGATQEGVVHMVGNAAEWVDDPRAPSVLAMERFATLLKPPPSDTEPWYMIKGGSFKHSLQEAAADLWLPAPGRYSADDVGFRCVR